MRRAKPDFKYLILLLVLSDAKGQTLAPQLTGAPTQQPTLQPSMMPSLKPSSQIPTDKPSSAPTVNRCVVCGSSELLIGSPDTLIGPPGFEETCQEAFEKGFRGELNEVLCLATEQLVQENCGCYDPASGGSTSGDALLSLLGAATLSLLSMLFL